ncbi:MAG: Rieske 2Fe-2S domain-containing protein, partial [Acidobacteria bacterium]|nr:Rieske 2Fe-2S domain-containing protein [Acidobacteriota bacterium]
MPYELVGRPEPPPVPNGWYAIAASAAVGPGQVLSIVAVERELVVFRTAAGEVSVVDAHCPHLGAHLGGGTVEDGSLRCPYHGWRFDTTGRCVEIPYA